VAYAELPAIFAVKSAFSRKAGGHWGIAGNIRHEIRNPRT
jgi:hypothetical protein